MYEHLTKEIKEYLLYLQVEKNLAPRTIQEYKMDLDLLKKFVEERQHKRWGEITYRDLRYFLHYIQEERNNSATARARKMASIRGFFTFLFQEKMIKENPSIHLKKPKLEKKLPVYLTIEECQRFIEVIREKSKNAERNVTIISLFLYTGIRLSELTALDIDDLDMTNQSIRIYGKGRKERLIPILPSLFSTLSTYLENRNRVLGANCYSFTPLFFTRKNETWKRIHKRTVHEIFINYSNLAKIDHKHFSAHKLRHTFATLLYAQGVDLLQLKSLLGHSHLSTTEIYTHTSSHQLKEAIMKHPLTFE
jgi:integrase/recombinase XerD